MNRDGTTSTTDPHDADFALRLPGLLGDFNRAGALHSADVHAAVRIAGMVGESSETVRLAMAFAIRAVRNGSVCVDLRQVADQVGDLDESVGPLPWPDAETWLAELAASPLVAVGPDPIVRPLRLASGLLYLDKYWRQERLVAAEFDARTTRPSPSALDPERLQRAVARLLRGPHEKRQRIAAVSAATKQLLIVAGGPGTGKTTAVARILAVLADQPEPPTRIALAAPTGKAAARLGEAVRSAISELEPHDQARLRAPQAVTLHRLLGWRPGNRMHHNESNPLPHDLVVVDEASMLSLTMVAKLLAALRPDARLILVGDPDQLESVDAGVVLADLVARSAGRGRRAVIPTDDESSDHWLAPDLAELTEQERGLAAAGVVTLTHRFRFGDQADIVELAEAITADDPDTVMSVLRAGGDQVRFVELPDEPGRSDQASAELLWDAVAHGGLDDVRDHALRAAGAARRAAEDGDAAGVLAAIGSHQILCAHRHGRFGASTWSRQVERWAQAVWPGYLDHQPWYPGRPVLMRVNDPDLGIYNGDTGVVVNDPERGRMAVFGTIDQPRLVSPTRLPEVETVHALTIHKSQGSQYDAVTLILPPLGSPLLTRELLYTAVTRARRRVTVVAGEHAVRMAVSRPVTRASGLRVIDDDPGGW